MAKSAPIPRAAKVFAKTATGRAAIARTARGRRATATGPSESLAATKNSPPVAPPTAARARISAIGRSAAIPSLGRSAGAVQIARNAIRVRLATARGISTNRVLTSPVTISRATIAPPATVRSASVPNSIVPARTVRNSTVRVSARKAAPTGRNIRAASRVRIGRAAKTRTTAGSLPSVRRSAAVAPIGSVRPSSRSAGLGLQRKRNPASASPRWCRALG